MAPNEIFSQLGLWMVNFCLQPFASYLSYFHLYEYESNLDPDPQHWGKHDCFLSKKINFKLKFCIEGDNELCAKN